MPEPACRCFDLDGAQILEIEGKLVSDLIPHIAVDANAAGGSQALDASRNVDAVTVNIGAFGDHVSNIDADAKLNSLIRSDIFIALLHGPLNFDGKSALHQQHW